MKRWYALGLVACVVLFAVVGCTAEDKRQWNEAMKEWRGDNIRFGSRQRSSSD
jgi:hypothetical protein